MDAINSARERYYFSNVLGTTEPGYCSLQPQPKSCVRDRAIASKVQVPLKVFLVKFMLDYVSFESFKIIFSLATSNNFAITLGGQHIYA
jgi:hypothetical protein